MIQSIYLVLKELVSGKFISFVVFLSVVMALLSLGVFNTIEKNVLTYIDSKFETAIAPNTIKVSALKRKILNKKALKKIKKIKAIKGIDKVLVATMPMQIRSSMFGNYGSDVPAIGVPYKMVKESIRSKYNKRLWRKGVTSGPLPALVTNVVLKSYNDVMAPANGLPRLSKESITGVPLTLIIGRSSIQRSDDYFSESVTIAGITDQLSTMALILPLKTVVRLNKLFGDGAVKYLNFYVETENHKLMLDVATEIEEMGYKVEVEKTVSAAIVDLKKKISLILYSIKYLILFLSIAAISFASIIAALNRAEYYRILRMLGASRTAIAFSIMVKYLAIGGASAFISIYSVSYLFREIIGKIQVAGINVSIQSIETVSQDIYMMGIVIPLISTVPAIFRLYFKVLGRD